MKTRTTIFFILLSVVAHSQIIISGKVTDKQGEALPGVNIYIENSYEGTTADSAGFFQFKTSVSGELVLVASFIGYQKWTNEVDLKNTSSIEIVLKESVNTIDAVTITAGIFAAADEKRAAVLQPLDIYTTASANGDVMAAIRTMPGTQASPDDGRLMVRGGDAYESKTYIDGLLTSKPYYSKTPDVATRGRFSPSLFSGVQFNTGGYSAEYGQALSSVLVLNSTDVVSSDVTGVSLMTIGAEANLTKAFKNSSVMASGGYMNMAPYHAIFPSRLNWTKPVESVNLSVAHRYKPSTSGLLKTFVNADYGSLAYNAPEPDKQELSLSNRTGTIYANSSYRDCISEKSCYKIGIATTYDANSIQLNQDQIDTKEISVESRFSLMQQFSEGVSLNYGISETFSQYQQDVSTPGEHQIYNSNLSDHTLGIFVESEIKFNKHVAIKPGLRGEYSTILNKGTIAPRFALAVKTGNTSQLSAAWGRYSQNPEYDYLKYNSALKQEEATHYILSYQAGSVAKRLFRTEIYNKTYKNLITWEGLNEYYPQNIANNGSGYARGIDLFWRDKKTVKRLEYWLTYSYIDTKRLYQNYPSMAKPNFISNHNVSVVTKYWLNSISTQVGFSFTASSPRNYDDTSTPEFMDVKTGWYNNLSLNLSKIFFLGNRYSVLYMSLSNVLGSDPVLAYRAPLTPDINGDCKLTPVKQDSKRFFFIGLYLNFDNK